MTHKKNDRRKHTRYQVKRQTLAVLKPHPIKLAQVINISEGGMAIHYVDNGGTAADYDNLELFITAEDLDFRDVAFDTVYDDVVPDLSDEDSVLRKSCFKFVNLSETKQASLRYFLSKHAKKPVNDRRKLTR